MSRVQLHCSIDVFRVKFFWFCNRDIPVTTEEPTDAVHEQRKIEVKDNPEKTAKDTKEEDEEEKVIIVGHWILGEHLSIENRGDEFFDFLQEMTLEEYEKLLFEKRKALESSRKTEERKVTLDKDLESMQRVERKKDDNLDIKLVVNWFLLIFFFSR